MLLSWNCLHDLKIICLLPIEKRVGKTKTETKIGFVVWLMSHQEITEVQIITIVITLMQWNDNLSKLKNHHPRRKWDKSIVSMKVWWKVVIFLTKQLPSTNLRHWGGQGDAEQLVMTKMMAPTKRKSKSQFPVSSQMKDPPTIVFRWSAHPKTGWCPKSLQQPTLQ